MCLLIIIGFIGIVLTLVSGQYSEHTSLFWFFLGTNLLTAYFYKTYRRAESVQATSENILAWLHFLLGVFGLTAGVLFVWLCVVIWL